MSETVVLDVEVNSAIEKVWNALTDSATLSKWMLFKSNDFRAGRRARVSAPGRARL